MRRTMDIVRDFHVAFKFPVGNRPNAGSPNPAVRGELVRCTVEMERLACELMEAAGRHPQDTLLLRLHLCQEELSELARAICLGRPLDALDALCDMRYVADGAAVELGMVDVFEEAFEEVHRSNMSKLNNGSPVFSGQGRLAKGPSYSPPDLKRFVR